MTSPDDTGSVPSPDERPVPRYGQLAPTPPPVAPQPAWHGQPQHGQVPYGQPQYGQSQYGQSQYGQPQYGQPQYGQGQGAQAPTGFTGAQGVYIGHTTAARPGIIPLRPLRVGEFLDGSFGALRSNPRVMIGLTTLVMSLIMTVAVLAQLAAARYLPGVVEDVFGTTTDEPTAVVFLEDESGLFLQATSALLLFLATPIITGMLTYSVSRSVLGQRATVADVWRACRARVGWLLLLTFLIGLGATLIVGLSVAGVVGAVAVGYEVSSGLGVAIGIVAVAGAAVALVWFTVRTLLAAPALVLEKLGPITALKRGWTLSRGAFWRLLGLYLLTSIIVNVVTSILTVPLGLAMIVVTFAAPSFVVVAITQGVLYTVIYTITIAFLAAVVALLYIDVRMRREGLDVELTAAAARLQDG